MNLTHLRYKRHYEWIKEKIEEGKGDILFVNKSLKELQSRGHSSSYPIKFNIKSDEKDHFIVEVDADELSDDALGKDFVEVIKPKSKLKIGLGVLSTAVIGVLAYKKLNN